MIWWLAFEKKPFQFWRKIGIQVLVILLQLYIAIKYEVMLLKKILLGWKNVSKSLIFDVGIYLDLQHLSVISTKVIYQHSDNMDSNPIWLCYLVSEEFPIVRYARAKKGNKKTRGVMEYHNNWQSVFMSIWFKDFKIEITQWLFEGRPKQGKRCFYIGWIGCHILLVVKNVIC